MNRMLLVVTATSSLVFSGIAPARAEIKPFYNPTNRASPTGFTTDYEEYRTIGCPGRELLGKPCPIPAPAADFAKFAPSSASTRPPSRTLAADPVAAPAATPGMESVPAALPIFAKSAPAPAQTPSRAMDANPVAAPVNTPAPLLPATPTPAVTLAKGHPLVLEDVNFEFDSDKLLPRAESILNQAVEDLRSASYPLTQVDGYTDSTGPDAYNLKLSERRAQSVKAFLIDRGVPGDSLKTAALGENSFVATNGTMDGRFRNRRVELHVAE